MDNNSKVLINQFKQILNQEMPRNPKKRQESINVKNNFLRSPLPTIIFLRIL